MQNWKKSTLRHMKSWTMTDDENCYLLSFVIPERTSQRLNEMNVSDQIIW